MSFLPNLPPPLPHPGSNENISPPYLLQLPYLSSKREKGKSNVDIGSWYLFRENLSAGQRDWNRWDVFFFFFHLLLLLPLYPATSIGTKSTKVYPNTVHLKTVFYCAKRRNSMFFWEKVKSWRIFAYRRGIPSFFDLFFLGGGKNKGFLFAKNEKNNPAVLAIGSNLLKPAEQIFP